VNSIGGNQVTRKSGCRIAGYQDIRKTEKDNFNLIPGCPDIHYLVA